MPAAALSFVDAANGRDRLALGLAASAVLHAIALGYAPHAFQRVTVIEPPKLTLLVASVPPPVAEPVIARPEPPPAPKPALRQPEPPPAATIAPPPLPVPEPRVSAPESAPPAPLEAKRVPAPETPTPPAVALKTPMAEPVSPPPAASPPAAPQVAELKRTPAAPPPAALPYLPPTVHASYLKNPKPEYPPGSYRRREEGLVTLLVRVATDGRPLEVKVHRSSGFPALDRSAREVVANSFRFAPARRGDQAEEGEVLVPIEFVLPKD